MSTLNYIPSSYPPGLAEYGKFTRIPNSTMVNYPSGGLGRFAVLTSEITNTDTFVPLFTASYSPAEAERGKFISLSGLPESPGIDRYAVLTYTINGVLTPVFSASYSPAEAEHGKFVRLDMSGNTLYTDTTGRGKYAILVYEVSGTEVDSLQTSAYPISLAEHGKFVKLDMTTITNYSSASRGRYAMIVNKVDSINASPMWSDKYPISRSENGKLIRNDISSLSWYPASGFGRFSIFTYDIT